MRLICKNKIVNIFARWLLKLSSFWYCLPYSFGKKKAERIWMRPKLVIMNWSGLLVNNRKQIGNLPV